MSSPYYKLGTSLLKGPEFTINISKFWLILLALTLAAFHYPPSSVLDPWRTDDHDTLSFNHELL